MTTLTRRSLQKKIGIRRHISGQHHPGIKHRPKIVRRRRIRSPPRITSGNHMFKFADNVDLVIQASNIASRIHELSNVEEWAGSNNLCLNRKNTFEMHGLHKTKGTNQNNTAGHRASFLPWSRSPKTSRWPAMSVWFVWNLWKWSKNSSEVCTYKYIMSSSLHGDPLTRSFALDPIEASPQTRLPQRSTCATALAMRWQQNRRPIEMPTPVTISLKGSEIHPFDRDRLLQSSEVLVPHPPHAVASNIWNKFPGHLSSVSTLAAFKQDLNHHIFSMHASLPWIWIMAVTTATSAVLISNMITIIPSYRLHA